MNLASDIRDPSHIDLLDKALASVRQMCVDYAAAQTIGLRADLATACSERDAARSQCETLQCTSANWEHTAKTLDRLLDQERLQCTALRSLLADARPLVKGRLLDCDGPHGDASILARIDDALAATAVRTVAVPPPPIAELVVPTKELIWQRTCIHHNDEERKTAACPVCLLHDAEALASALQHLAARARLHVDCQPARIALNAYRSRHPAPFGAASAPPTDAH